MAAQARWLLIVGALLDAAFCEPDVSFGEGGCTTMRARLERLRTETASLEAKIRDTCEPPLPAQPRNASSNEPSYEVGPRLPASPSRQAIRFTNITRRREGNLSSLPAGPSSQSGCSETEVELISSTITGLHDVESLLVALNETSTTCRRCILATVASVCGENCARERLHLMLDEPRLATGCVLSQLASILSAAQALLLERAVGSLEPVGVSITLPLNSEINSTATLLAQDLFLPTDETIDGQPVLRGIDTNQSIFVCSRTKHLDTWVISSSSERSTRANCKGEVWIDRLSGKAQLAAAAGGSSSVVTLVIHRGLSEACGSLLRSAAMPAVHGGKLAFPNTIGADEVACWLARLFGPYSAIPVGQVPREIELPEGLGSIILLTDLVLAPGRSLVVRGGNNTILVGPCQVRVQARSTLTLDSITVANSVRSTAIAIEAGSVRLSTSTVRNCSAYMNAVNSEGRFESRGGAISVNTAGRVELALVDMYANIAAEGESASSGGAIYCVGGSSIAVSLSKLSRNVAHRAGLSRRDLYGAAQGGAVFISNSSLVIHKSEFFQNVARDGGFNSSGGALYGRDGSSITMRGSKLYGNLVENGGLLFTAADKVDAGSYGGAMYIQMECFAEVIECEVCDNIAIAGAQWTMGGAVDVYDGCSLSIVRSKLLRNAAQGGGDGVDSGAVSLWGGANPSICWLNSSEISENRATATDGAGDSRAGAVMVSQAQLTVVECKVSRNVVSGVTRAFGGAFVFAAGSRVLMQRSDLSGNSATGGALLSQGGGIFSDIMDTGELQIDSTILSENCANGSAAPAAGGALYADSGSTTLIDSSLLANTVVGLKAHGGAVHSSGTILIIRTTIRLNRVHSMSAQGEAFGGGVYNDVGMMTLNDSLLVENVASIASPSEKASAGALYNAVGAQSILDGCVLRSNTAGGRGYFQATDFRYDDDKRRIYEASKAAHIFSSGIRVDIIRTTIFQGSNLLPITHSAQIWIVVGGGALYLHSSNFSAAVDSDVTPWLLASSESALDAEILVRNCTVRNLKLQSVAKAAKVGVVNSEFEPPLNSSAIATLQPGECASVVANEQMCDPRALCELRKTVGGVLSGGVQCECVGHGLRDKPGMLPDGQQCEQEPSIGMLLQSQEVSLKMSKPSNGSAGVLMVVQAGGETRRTAVYSASMVHRRWTASDGVLPNSSRIWSRLDEAQLSLDGHHLIWSATPPANDSEIELDARSKRYVVMKTFAFQLGLDCHGAAECVADGDTVETVVDVSSDSGSVRSAVRITTLIQSLISCKNSPAWVEYNLQNVPTSTAMRVYLDAYDVDKLPISHNRAPVEFRFGQILLPQKWNTGSNLYVAEVSADVTEKAGQYDLVVTALNGSAGPCILLRRSIEVLPNNAQRIVAGALAGAMVLTLGTLGYLLHRKKEGLRQALRSFLSFEGLIMLELCLEIWDVAGDAFFFRTVIQSKERAWVSNMLIPYAVFFAASCTASLLAAIFKLRLFLHKWRSRGQAGSQTRRHTLGGVPISPPLSNHKAVSDLKSRFDERQLQRYTYYCYLLTAVVEDIPMGTMNTIYFGRMLEECVETFNIAEKSERVCDLDSSNVLLLLLTTLTSAAMLGYKLAHVEIIKFAMTEQKRLEEERAALLSELGESLSPELALQVEKVIDRRKSFVPNGLATLPYLSKLPKLACADEAETEETQSTAQVVRSVASSESGDVMTPFGALNRTTSEARAQAQARLAIHVQPITPRTRARSDQFNPEAEHALTSTRARQPDAAQSDAGALCDSIVPYAGPGVEVQSVDSGGRAPSGSKVHPLPESSLKSPDSSDESDDEQGRAILDE